jgi:small nuclear ribonucleoprotein (snRNP)-like protein
MLTGKKNIGSVGIALLFCCYITAIAFPLKSEAKTKVIAIEGVSYNVGASLSENLMGFAGKRVSITLRSGKNITGLVKSVGDHLLHLEQLDGKEYFDALIRIDNITAIGAKFREVAR